MEKILSVSVASYNLGEMILTNLKSFCESNVAEKIEVIVTDDGSKDNTTSIVESYAKDYPTIIKLIKKQNEGPGSTVNSGIKNATGKYFRMVDGDDWVVTENLEYYIELLTNTDADLIVSDYDIFDNEKQQITETIKAEMVSCEEKSIDEVFAKFPMQMHALTFKTKILKNNNIILDNCFYTDVEYMLFPMPFIKKVVYLNKSIYVYRVAQAGQSVSIPSMKKNIAQHDLVFNHLLDWYGTLDNLSSGQKYIISNRIASMANVELGTLLFFDPSKEYKRKVKEFFKLVKSKNLEIYCIFKKSKRCKILLYSGFMLYSFVAKMYTKKITKANKNY